MSAAAASENIVGDRGAPLSGAAPAEVRSSRLRAGIAASSLLAHGFLVLTFVLFDPAPNPFGRAREIPVEVVMETAPPEQRPAAPEAGEKSAAPDEAMQAQRPRQRPEVEANPKPANEEMSVPHPVAMPAAPQASATAGPAPAESARKHILNRAIVQEHRPASKQAGGPRRDWGGENRLPAQIGFALPFDSGPENFRAVAVPLPTSSGGEAMRYQFILGGMLERVKHYPRAAVRRGAKGAATIGFVLDGSGRVASVSLLRSSGEADLDAESVALVNRAAPFPPPPQGAKRSFAIEVAFGLRN